jgi:hypothetical protein
MIERNGHHYKDVARVSMKDDPKKRATTSGATSEVKQGGDITAVLGKRVVKRAAAAVASLPKASA